MHKGNGFANPPSASGRRSAAEDLGVAAHVLFPEYGDRKVEGERDHRAEPPARRPCPADAGKPERNGKDKDEHDAQDEVGKGADHEPEVPVTTAHGRVRIDLHVHHKEERRNDADVQRAAFDRERGACALLHKNADQRFGKYFTDGDEQRCERGGDQHAIDKPAADTVQPVRPVILRNIVRQPRRTGTHARRTKNQEFEPRRKPVRDADPLFRRDLVDLDLDHEVPDRNKAVLQHDGQREQQHKFEQRPRKDGRLLLGAQPHDTAQHQHERKEARRTLRYEGRPRHARNAPRLHHEIIEHDVRDGGRDEEQERRAAVAQGGKNAGTEIVQHQERHAEIIDVEVDDALFKRCGRRSHRFEQRAAACQSYAEKHGAEYRERNERGINGGLYLPVFFRAEIAGAQHRAARVRPERDRHKDIDDSVGRADRGERGLTSRKLPRDNGVRKGIQLLKHGAAQKRQNVFDQNFPRFSYRQIRIHGGPPFPIEFPAKL